MVRVTEDRVAARAFHWAGDRLASVRARASPLGRVRSGACTVHRAQSTRRSAPHRLSEGELIIGSAI